MLSQHTVEGNEVITIESDSEASTVIDIEVYFTEQEFCIDRNGDISPNNSCHETNLEASETCSCQSQSSQTLQCHDKLKRLGNHLADICGVTLSQQKQGIFSPDGIEFAKLASNCGNELMGLGEYLIDVANLIDENQRDFNRLPYVISQDLSSLSGHVSKYAPSAQSQKLPRGAELPTASSHTDKEKSTSSPLESESQQESLRKHMMSCPVQQHLMCEEDSMAIQGTSVNIQQVKYHFQYELCCSEFSNKHPYHWHLDWHATHSYRCEQCNQIFLQSCLQSCKGAHEE